MKLRKRKPFIRECGIGCKENIFLAEEISIVCKLGGVTKLEGDFWLRCCLRARVIVSDKRGELRIILGAGVNLFVPTLEGQRAGDDQDLRRGRRASRCERRTSR